MEAKRVVEPPDASVRYVDDSSAVSVERRRAAGARRRDRMGRDRREASFGQAEISVYLAAMLLFLFLVVLSFQATNELAAFAVTIQTGTVLLLSPEVLRPLRGLRYFSRPLSKIRARRQRIFRRTLIGFALLLALGTLRVVDVVGTGSDARLTGLIVVLLGLLCGFYVLYLLAAWMVEQVFEGAAETWMQGALARFGSAQANEVRRASAGVFFLVGTLLTFCVAYV
jgi:hypothetical protein